MDGLTKLQDSCLRTIDRYIKHHRRAPTRRELAELTGQKSTNGINQILDALVKKAYLRIDPPSHSRNIVLLRVPSKQLSLLDESGTPAKRGVQSHDD